MKNAWIAYVLMTTASSSATTTRMGNSRQNERLRRGLRAAWRPPPEPVPAGAAPCALSSAALSSAEALSALASAPGSFSGPGAWSSARSARPAPLIFRPFRHRVFRHRVELLVLAPRAPAPTAQQDRGRDDARGPGHAGHRGRGHGAQRRPADLEHGGARGARVQLGLLECIGDGQVADLRRRPDDQERPARDLALRDRAVARVIRVVARVLGVAAMVSHDPQVTCRDDVVELDR